jgi:hypothetical protein
MEMPIGVHGAILDFLGTGDVRESQSMFGGYSCARAEHTRSAGKFLDMIDIRLRNGQKKSEVGVSKTDAQCCRRRPQVSR